jgi:hypothetical protein
MTSISGVEFEEAWEQRVSGEIEGVSVFIIGREALLRNKAAANRPKDRVERSHGLAFQHRARRAHAPRGEVEIAMVP